jgi:hypothetical protein
MAQQITIPLGGVDYAGQPLPPEATYYLTGAGDGLPGLPYRAPERAEKPSADKLPGEPYVAPPQAAEASQERQIGVPEAVLSGIAHGATFGTAPAISGLAAVSGMQSPEGLDPNLPPETQADIAAGQALARPFVGAYNLLTGRGGPDIRQAYNEARDKALKDYEATQRQHPYVTAASELAGGLAALPVTPLTSLRAATAIGRIGQGVKVGAVTGGLTAAGEATGRGAAPLEVAKAAGGGALAGAPLGAAAGGVIEGGARIAGKVASLRRGKFDPELEAARQVQEMYRGPGGTAYERVRSDIPALQAGSEAGAPMALVDFGGRPATGLLRSATDISPEARDLADQVLGARYRQQAPRVIDWIQSKWGGPSTDQTIEAMQTLARRENAPAYKRAYTVAASRFPLGLATPELNALVRASPSLRTALTEAAQQGSERAAAEGLRGTFKPRLQFDATGSLSQFPDLQLWDYAQRILRDKAQGLQTQIGGTAKSQGAALGSIHRQVLAELDRIAPEFGRARGTAATFFKANDALEAGQNFVGATGISDGAALRAIRKMSPTEQRLFSLGFANELSERLGARNYSSDIINNIYLNSPRAERRIAIALGPDAAAQFESVLRIESIMDKAYRAIGGSQTSTNIGGMAKLGGTIAAGAELVHQLDPTLVIAGALAFGSREAARKINEDVALRIAQMLLSQNPATIERGYSVMARNPVIRESLRRASDLTGRELISRFGPGNVGAAEMAVAGKLGVPGLAPPKPPEHGQPAQYHYEDEQSGPAPLK